MKKSSKRNKKFIKTIQSLSKSSEENLTESELELLNKTVKKIKNTVDIAVSSGREAAFLLLNNEEKGYSKKIQKAIETRVSSMTFPIDVHIHLEDKK
jgi:flagellar biosynthesis/type III secretory pathway M-ring protein FliF/YscJ